MADDVFLAGAERHEDADFVATVFDIDGDDEGDDDDCGDDDDDEDGVCEATDGFDGTGEAVVFGGINGDFEVVFG